MEPFKVGDRVILKCLRSVGLGPICGVVTEVYAGENRLLVLWDCRFDHCLHPASQITMVSNP